MKKQFLFIPALMLVGAVLVLQSCKKADTTAPEITITGGGTAMSSLNATFANPAATATDDVDGDLTASITVTGTVNKDLAGDYTLTYSATDAAGNAGTATLVVTVRNDAYAMAGTYNGSETDANGPYTYSGNTTASKVVTITTSTTVNNRVNMTRLGDYANNSVYLNITGTTIDLPTQTSTAIGTGQTSDCTIADHSFVGTGSKTTTPIGFTLTYSDAKVAPCAGTRTSVAAVFVKQ